MSKNNDAYAAALSEIEEGRLDKGAWARAYAESGGDESKAKANYIKARAESIEKSAEWTDTQPPVDDAPNKRAAPTAGDKGLPTNHAADFYKTAIGETSLGYYLYKFQTFDEKGPGLHASWNWAAFFFTGFWALYRKMYGWLLVWVVIFTVFGVASKAAKNSHAGSFWYLAANLFVVVCFAAYANSIYHAKIQGRINAAKKGNVDAALINTRLLSGSGVHTWVAYIFGGIPVVGIVAAIALPAYQDYTKRQVVAATPTVDLAKGVATPANTQTPSIPPLDEYIAEVKGLPIRERYKRIEHDMGVKFPMQLGNLGFLSRAYTSRNFAMADDVEHTQTWGRHKLDGNSAFIVFQNRTYYPIVGMVLEMQAEERQCDNKGKAYYMNLFFEKPVQATSLAGVTFSLPDFIPNSNRCMDVVDLIYE